MKPVAAYFVSLAVFVIVDFIWLGFVAREFYRSSIVTSRRYATGR